MIMDSDAIGAGRRPVAARWPVRFRGDRPPRWPPGGAGGTLQPAGQYRSENFIEASVRSWKSYSALLNIRWADSSLGRAKISAVWGWDDSFHPAPAVQIGNCPMRHWLWRWIYTGVSGESADAVSFYSVCRLCPSAGVHRQLCRPPHRMADIGASAALCLHPSSQTPLARRPVCPCRAPVCLDPGSRLQTPGDGRVGVADIGC